MRILMLGWEFPPFISGGLGTACYGLTRALDKAGVEVLFVLPKAVPGDYSGHVRLLSPSDLGGGHPDVPGSVDYTLTEFEHVRFRTVPSEIVSPYNTPSPGSRSAADVERGAHTSAQYTPGRDGIAPEAPPAQSSADYTGDVMHQAERYAALAVYLTRNESFDAIHAHDWMTYPAGLALAQITGKPLAVHVHSTEYDRAGENVHGGIYDIERRGMAGADRVICVSDLTRRMCVNRYQVPAEKTEVVYNGIDRKESQPTPAVRILRGDRIVLFLGRLTFQKGPEYFIAAAQKVLSKVDNVKFVVAGSGDMASDMIKQAVDCGIGSKVLFTGFLRGGDVERVFRLADVYVMPSVSEPFGIAPLEAIQNDVPVIMSKNSGVSEVVKHALKVDFWDVDDIADKIVAVLRHKPLAETLREQADIEVRKLNWAGAAHRCVEIYRGMLAPE